MKRNWVILIFLLCLATMAKAQTSAENKPLSTQETTVQKIKVFPNPATNIINVLGLKNSNKAAITIVDTYGNIVQQHQWEIKNNALNIRISTLDAGIYIITIRSEEQDVKTKFYKQ